MIILIATHQTLKTHPHSAPRHSQSSTANQWVVAPLILDSKSNLLLVWCSVLLQRCLNPQGWNAWKHGDVGGGRERERCDDTAQKDWETELNGNSYCWMIASNHWEHVKASSNHLTKYICVHFQRRASRIWMLLHVEGVVLMLMRIGVV